MRTDLDRVTEEIKLILSQADNFEARLPELLCLLAKEFDSQWAVYWKTDRNKTLRFGELWKSSGLDAKILEQDTRNRVFSFGEGMPGKVWKTRKLEKSFDVISDMALPRSLKASSVGLVEGIWFPIFNADKVFGVIEIMRTKKSSNDPDLYRLLEKLGNEIGRFIIGPAFFLNI